MVQAYGAKIDGVGLQGHFIVGSTPSESTLLAQIDTYAALGLEVAYTEVDVRFSSIPPTTAGLAQQATDYGSVTSACLASDACVGITVWYVFFTTTPPPRPFIMRLAHTCTGTLTMRTRGSRAPSRARATRVCTGPT